MVESVEHPADFVGLGFQLFDEGSFLADLMFALLSNPKQHFTKRKEKREKISKLMSRLKVERIRPISNLSTTL